MAYAITGYLMQARSTTSGHLVTWRAASPDYSAAYWPGPGSPEFVACTVLAQTSGDLPVILDPPALTSMSIDQGDERGGETVVLTGTSFADVTAIYFGYAAAPVFTVDSPTQITATAPAHATGSVNVTVASLNGTSNGISYEYWSPADLAGVTLFLDKPDYVDGASPRWTARVGNDYTGSSGSEPTAVSGAPFFYRAATDRLGSGQGLSALLDLATATPFEVAVVLNIATLPSGGGSYDFLLSDVNSRFALQYDSSGVAYLSYFDTGYKNCSRAGVGTGRKTIITRRRSSAMSVSTDGGSTFGTAVAVGNFEADGGNPGLGTNSNAPTYKLDATVLAVVMTKGTQWSAGDYTKFNKWAANRHP